ncbi:MAG: hypothetical protein FWD94_08660 [Treponema sp.]|nr:hypothetical protein [Treponema sp.]
MLTKLVKKLFRGFFEIFLWIIWILCAIGGAILGGTSGGGGMGFLGFVVGAVLGFLSIILLGGTMATFLDMAKNVEELKAGRDFPPRN